MGREICRQEFQVNRIPAPPKSFRKDGWGRKGAGRLIVISKTHHAVNRISERGVRCFFDWFNYLIYSRALQSKSISRFQDCWIIVKQ